MSGCLWFNKKKKKEIGTETPIFLFQILGILSLQCTYPPYFSSFPSPIWSFSRTSSYPSPHPYPFLFLPSILLLPSSPSPPYLLLLPRFLLLSFSPSLSPFFSFLSLHLNLLPSGTSLASTSYPSPHPYPFTFSSSSHPLLLHIIPLFSSPPLLLLFSLLLSGHVALCIPTMLNL